MRTRKADKAGTWYAGTADALAREVDDCVRVAAERYRAPEAEGTPVAIVVPHAGLAYSGPVAAAAYSRVRDCFKKVDVFVVFGASHRVPLTRPAIWNEGAWETPLGPIEIDYTLARDFIDNGVGESNPRPHLGDNAIELQTPFIKRLFPEARMVPVAVPPLPDAWRTGELAVEAAGEIEGVVVAVASTDLTHYGAAFGVTPAGTGQPALDWARDNDRRFLDALVDMDLDNIVGVAERDGSACGAGAAAAAAGWALARGCRAGRLLVHTNSHEVQPTGVAEHFVGYAGLVYEVD